MDPRRQPDGPSGLWAAAPDSRGTGTRGLGSGLLPLLCSGLPPQSSAPHTFVLNLTTRARHPRGAPTQLTDLRLPGENWYFSWGFAHFCLVKP